MARRMDQHVLEFEISVDNTMRVQVRDGLGDFRHVKRRPMFIKTSTVLLQRYIHVRVQRAAGAVGYYEYQLVPLLERVI